MYAKVKQCSRNQLMKAATGYLRREDLDHSPPWGSPRARKGTVLQRHAFLPLSVLSFTLEKKLENNVGTGRTLDLKERLQEGVALLALYSEASCAELVMSKEQVAVR